MLTEKYHVSSAQVSLHLITASVFNSGYTWYWYLQCPGVFIETEAIPSPVVSVRAPFLLHNVNPQLPFTFKTKTTLGTEEIAPWLRAFHALAEGCGMISGPHVVV